MLHAQKKLKQDKPRLLFPIGGFYPSEGGGPSVSMYWLSKALVTEGFEVTIITSNRDVNGKVAIDKWLVTDYGRIRYVKTRFHFFPLRILFHTWKHLKSHDVIHLTSMFYPLSVFVFLLCKLNSKKVIWSPRGELDDGALTYRSSLKLIILKFIRRLAGKNVIIHTTSFAETRYVQSNFSNAVKIIELPNYLQLPALISADRQPVLLYLGRIHPKKNIHSLIDALATSEIFKKASFVLYIAGDQNNEYGRQLQERVTEKKIADKVKFTGTVFGTEKQRLLATSYFLILPSITENFGNVVVESLAQGTPVIASKGTPWEQLESREAGFWVDCQPDEIRQAVEHVITLPSEKYMRMRSNARLLATECFDIRRNIRKWEEAYQRTISEKQPEVLNKTVFTNA